MDYEEGGSHSLSTGLRVMGFAACLAAVMGSGGAAFVAGIIGLACLAGSYAVSRPAEDTSFECDSRESDAAQAAIADAPGLSPCQEAEPCHRWRQAVGASRCGSRQR